MSFVRLDAGEFPPLNQTCHPPNVFNKKQPNANLANQGFNIGNQKKQSHKQKKHQQQQMMQQQQHKQQLQQQVINNGSDFVKGRVGYQLIEYQQDLEKALRVSQVGHLCDFIVAPIEPLGSLFYNPEFETLTDLVLSAETWHTRVALDIGFPPMNCYDRLSAKHFEEIFDHALYLNSPVIIVSSPGTSVANACIASTINQKLSEIRTELLILIKVPFDKDRYKSNSSPWSNNVILSSQEEMSTDSEPRDSHHLSHSQTTSNESDISLWDSNRCSNGGGLSCNSISSPDDNDVNTACLWKQWNLVRNHLRIDHRVGVCLLLNDDLADDEEELSRWEGEPVRMVIIHTDQFVKPPGHNASLRLTGRCKEFLKRLVLANSFRISFVLESRPKQDINPYLEYLNSLFSTFSYQNEDPLRPWNDKIQPPLQPLSSNLDSGTYSVFEMDSMKYIQYRDAMVLALRQLLSDEKLLVAKRKIVLMILGAGRGPLVDAMISAIKHIDTDCCKKFKIYALDKNPSSVKTLLYKQKKFWADKPDLYETEVIESDMRTWTPPESADIIASELLGSLGDNELSPECLDGVWRFSTPRTISIPQSYTSYIAPICSYKLHQELSRLRTTENNIYEQIYVCRLTNCYHIAKPQQLFTFEHRNLSIRPEERCNERYIELTFESKVDTVCHGFAGYFMAYLYGRVTLSTVFENKTPNMDSWFPAYIPLRNPVQMPKGTRLTVHFWRKESPSSVWYEWVLTSPEQSRVYSLCGLNSAMSKSI